MSAISNEESQQILDYGIITLKSGKTDGDTNNENYPTDVLRKPTSKKKSKWWMQLSLLEF